MLLCYSVKSLKSTATPGPDGLSAVWFKLFYPHIKLLFHAMLNACLKLSYFPLTWRAASILILKKPSKHDYFNPSAFRGISILNASSKVFEIIIHDILKKLAHEGKWFSENQHGFRPGKSTESASCTLINLIENNKNKKMATCCAFLDIKSAFDAA